MNEFTGVFPDGVAPFLVSEEKDSYDEPISTSQWSPSVTLRCPWVNRYQLIGILNGRRWPHATGSTVPIATGFQVKGDGHPQTPGTNTDSQLFEYVDALITVNYTRAVQSTGTNSMAFDFFTEVIEPFIEYQRVPHDQLYWSDANPNSGIPSRQMLKPEQAPAIPLYRERYTRTYFGINLPLPAVFTTLQNNINSMPVFSPLLGITYAAKTVLYGNRRITYNLRSDGSQAANLSLDFTFRQETWREYWHFDINAYRKIENAAGDEIAFPPEADLSAVLMS